MCGPAHGVGFLSSAFCSIDCRSWATAASARMLFESIRLFCAAAKSPLIFWNRAMDAESFWATHASACGLIRWISARAWDLVVILPSISTGASSGSALICSFVRLLRATGFFRATGLLTSAAPRSRPRPNTATATAPQAATDPFARRFMMSSS